MKNWPICSVIVFLVIVLINPKTRLFSVIIEQLKIYKNDKINKFYWLDFVTFLLAPIVLAVYISQQLPFYVVLGHAETIITIFSLIATLPLSFLALFIDKILQKKKEKEVAKEAFVSITIDILYSMLLIGTIIVGAFVKLSSFGEKFIVGLITFFAIKIALNILMILKRIFIIWDIEEK